MAQNYTFDDIPLMMNSISWQLKRIAEALESIDSRQRRGQDSNKTNQSSQSSQPNQDTVDQFDTLSALSALNIRSSKDTSESTALRRMLANLPQDNDFDTTAKPVKQRKMILKPGPWQDQ